MQVNETLNEGLKRGYAITVTAAELEAKVNEKLAEAQPEVEMKGFRKGKVPMALLKKQFGQKVMGEAMQEAIDGAMQEHFEKSGDRPAMQPDVKMANEDWKEGDDVEVTMTYEALPEIPEVDLTSIKLEKMVVKADDAAVEEALANLAETAQDFESRKAGTKAKDGDQIVFDFLGKVDGEALKSSWLVLLLVKTKTLQFLSQMITKRRTLLAKRPCLNAKSKTLKSLLLPRSMTNWQPSLAQKIWPV